MKYIITIMIACALLAWLFFSDVLGAYCTSEAPAKIPFAKLLQEYEEEDLKLHPLAATYLGYEHYNHLLPNVLSKAHNDRLTAFYTSYKAKLADYDRTELDEDERVSYDVLMWECDMKLKNMALNEGFTPLDQFRGLHLTMGQLASGESAQPFKTVKDYENWQKRVFSFLEWCDSAVFMMKKGMDKKIVLPKVLAQKTIPQLIGLAKEPVEENLFYKPIKKFPTDISEEDKDRLIVSYTSMIKDRVIPTLTRMYQFMEQEYLPACRETAGIWALSNGEEIYNHQIKTYTTTSMTADEIFDLGMSEVKRIAVEMEKVKENVGFEGDLQAFFDHVRNNKELMPFKKPDEVIANFNSIHNKMKPHLKKLFDFVPKTEFEVRRTEAFREASASAEYMSGSIDGSRPGIFYVPIPDVLKYNYFSDEDLFLHEAIPGHHYQFSLQQENEKLPDFRRRLWYSAYGEGWALYSESLGKELGLYQDPYQYFGMLSWDMHRAIRLVVDVGMHVKQWTREQAIAYSLQNEADSEEDITAEIERYMSWPGQALSYKIGQLKIRSLRAQAEQELGVAFDIREFHNQVLQSGSTPLNLLEKSIHSWIKMKKASNGK